MTQQPSRVVQENVDALVQREVAGRIEHGADMDRDDFPVSKWLEELISENLDSANYGRKLMHMLPKLLAATEQLERLGYSWGGESWQPAAAQEAVRQPDGYHYRYSTLYGTITYIRKNNGEEVNGSKPVEAVPYWYAPVAAAPACPSCAAPLLFECVGCSVSNYPNASDSPGAVIPLASTPAAPGIDHGNLISSLQSMRDRMMEVLVPKFGEAFDGDFDTMLEAINVLKRIDASPKGGDDDTNKLRVKWLQVRGLAAGITKNLKAFAEAKPKDWCGALDDSLDFADLIEKEANKQATSAEVGE